MYESGKTAEVVNLLQNLSMQAYRLHVPIEFIPVDTAMAKAGKHRLNRSFFEHLQWSIRNDGLIKENPLNCVKVAEISMAEDVSEYIRYKLEKFEKDIISFNIMDEVAKCGVLKKLLETPLHVVRKMIRLRGDAETANRAGKKELMEHFAKIASLQILSELHLIVGADITYSKELESQLLNPNEENYRLMLHRINCLGFSVLNFLRLSFKLIK